MTEAARELDVTSDGVAIHRIGRNKRIAWSAAGFFGALFVAGAVFNSVGAILLGFFAFPTSVWLLLELHFGQPIATGETIKPGRVRIAGDDLLVEHARGVASFDRRDVYEGWIEPTVGSSTIVLRMRDDDLVSFWIRDPAEARAALLAIGVAPSQQALRVRLASSAAQRRFGRFFALTLLVGLAPCGFAESASFFLDALKRLLGGDLREALPVGLGVALVALFVFAGYRLLRFLTPPWATIGTDGVVVRGLGTRRFVPFTAVRAITEDARGVVLELDEGRELRLPTPPRATALLPNGSPSIARDALAERLREAMKGASHTRTSATVELLDRRGRSFSEWRRALRDHFPGGNYRRPGVDRDDLVGVVEDAANPAERRIAAAVALSRVDDGETRGRVRIAANACADDRLRVALEQAALGELEENEVERVVRAMSAGDAQNRQPW